HRFTGLNEMSLGLLAWPLQVHRGFVAALSADLAHSRSWRVWEFDSDIVSVVFIGLWEAFYQQKFNISGIMVELPMYSEINSSWVISNEISYGQGLMLLANFMMSVALIFSSVALFVSRIKAPYPDFLRLCYKASALLLFLSCTCITIAVSWNFTVDFYGQTTLDFPLTFPVEREMITNKRLSYVFPLGTATSILLFGIFIFCYKIWLTSSLLLVNYALAAYELSFIIPCKQLADSLCLSQFCWQHLSKNLVHIFCSINIC
uniref:Uncharacterized protein n=1 Tax=Bos indicus x Bos taurus TaxID=30522 RepID=A0A4W2EPH5_BOBOX